MGPTHRVDADSDSREYIPTADSPFTVSRPPPFRLSFHLYFRVVPVCVSRMPSSASSRNATAYDTAYMTPASLDWSISGNPSIGAAPFGAPPPPFDGSTASTRLQSSVPIASERVASITSPSSLGTSASATSFNSALATPPSLVGTSDTRLQSSVPLASERDLAIAGIRASVTSPPSLIGTDVDTSASDNSPNFGLSRSTRLQLEASFAAKLDDIVADITNLVDNLRKVGSIPTPPVTKVQSDAIRYLAGRLNIPTLIRLFNLVLVNDLVTSLFLAEATSMRDDELLASCTLPFIPLRLKPPNPAPPVGKAGFEVWVLTKGGQVSVHHRRLYRTIVHAHLVGSYADP